MDLRHINLQCHYYVSIWRLCARVLAHSLDRCQAWNPDSHLQASCRAVRGGGAGVDGHYGAHPGGAAGARGGLPPEREPAGRR